MASSLQYGQAWHYTLKTWLTTHNDMFWNSWKGQALKHEIITTQHGC